MVEIVVGRPQVNMKDTEKGCVSMCTVDSDAIRRTLVSYHCLSGTGSLNRVSQYVTATLTSDIVAKFRRD